MPKTSKAKKGTQEVVAVLVNDHVCACEICQQESPFTDANSWQQPKAPVPKTGKAKLSAAPVVVEGTKQEDEHLNPYMFASSFPATDGPFTTGAVSW